MFSRRIPWELEPNDYSLLLERKRASGAPLLDLTESNPTRAGFHYPPEIAAALADPRNLLYEPNPLGLLSAREAVAQEMGAPVDRILLTASTSESYSYLFKLLCDPGDSVLVPQPSYPLFEFLAKEALGRLGAGEDHHPRRVAIQPVHQKRVPAGGLQAV